MRRPRIGVGKATVQGQLLQLAIEHAVKALRDERVRHQVVATGSAVADRVRGAYAERTTRQSSEMGGRAAAGEPSVWDRVGAPFGHERLVARISTLRVALDQLRAGIGPAATALVDVDLAVGRLEIAVAAAQHLPLLSRQRAHLQVSDQLHKLEQAVFDAAMAGPPPPGLLEGGELGRSR